MKTLLSHITALFIAVFAALPAAADSVTASGTFIGASDHITTGGVSVIKTSAGGAVVILDADFSLDGAPAPKVGFGKDGEYVKATDLGELKNINGLQAYAVPADVNVDDFNEVYIWCEKFSVPLGIAALSGS